MSKAHKKTRLEQSYEQLLKGDVPAGGDAAARFWDELFLLRVNKEHLVSTFKGLKIDGIVAHTQHIRLLIKEATNHLHDENDIRVTNALVTLGTVLQTICRMGPSKAGYNLIDIVFGTDMAEMQCRVLLEAVASNLESRRPQHVRESCLQLLTVLAAAATNPNENPFAEYFMQTCIFDSLIALLRDISSASAHGRLVAFLLAVLCHYRKYEAPNPYANALQAMADDLVLHNLSSVMMAQLSAKSTRWVSLTTPQESSSLLATVTTLVADMFVSPDIFDPRVHVDQCGAVLFLLYQLAYSHPQALTVFSHTEVLNPDEKGDTQRAQVLRQPTNVLSTLLGFTSFVMQDSAPDNQHYTQLSLTILAILAEDERINAYMHDGNVKAPISLRRAEMRHRPATTVTAMRAPLVLGIFDLCIEYMVSHMSRSFDVDAYTRCLEVVHRLLCYQKTHLVRLNYEWANLWSALSALFKFVIQNEEEFRDRFDIFAFLSKAVTIINLFITYGDTFLPDPNTYDQLYYELIRERKHFDALKELATRHRLYNDRYAASAARIDVDMGNIRDIIDHFSPKVEAWATQHKDESLEPEQVLAIVRENYDTLTLKLQESLDKYERYTEHPAHVGFLSQVARHVVAAFMGQEMTVQPLPKPTAALHSQ